MKAFLPLLVAALLALPARSQVINDQLTDNAKSNSLADTAYSSTVAALSYTGSTWNVGFDPSGSDLLDSTGAGSSVGFSLTGDYFSTNNGTSPLKLVQESLGSTSGLTLTLTGLNSADTYNLYLYDGFNGFGTNFTVDGVTEGATGSTAGTFTAGSNFVEFTGVQPTGTSIVVTLTNGTQGYDLIQGFQLAVAPEPTTWAMMLVGMGALVWLARRKLA